MTDTTQKKKRTPRGYDTILAGAKSLPLKERIELAKELTRINTDEVQGKQREAEEAAALLKS